MDDIVTSNLHGSERSTTTSSWHPNPASLGGCTYHVAHPGGRAEEHFPVNSYEAESRRIVRFRVMVHTPGDIDPPPEEPLGHHPHLPCVGLRASDSVDVLITARPPTIPLVHGPLVLGADVQPEPQPPPIVGPWYSGIPFPRQRLVAPEHEIGRDAKRGQMSLLR